MMLTKAYRFCEECFSESIGKEEWIKVVVGGSNAKETSDTYSDIDICIIVSNDIKSIRELILKKSNIIFDNADENIVLLYESSVFDIHLTTDDYCTNTINDFEQAKNLSNTSQDFLWNICKGITIFGLGIYPIYQVTYSSYVQKIILRNYLEVLSTQKIDVAFYRNDIIQQWESLLTISKIVVNIGFALNRELFWGYKNLHLKHNFPDNILNILAQLKNMNNKNWTSQFPILKESIEDLRIEINLFVDNKDNI